MATKDRIRDEDEDEADEKAKKKGDKKPGVMKLVILGAIAVFVAVLGAQVAAPLINNMIGGSSQAAADDEEAADEEALEEDEEIELAAADEAIQPAIYTPLDPPFVVSFTDVDGDSRFLQLTLQAMARDEHTIDQVKQHSPAIRNAFLFLISGYKVEDLSTLEGKEKLRTHMLGAANEIMEKNTGHAGIEELFFTSLVIQ
jgi:flagellar protein FliL